MSGLWLFIIDFDCVAALNFAFDLIFALTFALTLAQSDHPLLRLVDH